MTMTSLLSANRRTARRLGWLYLFTSVAIGGYLLATPAPSARAKHDYLSRTDPSGWAAATRATTQPIESIRVGMRVLGNNPDASEVDETLADPEPAQWRKLWLRMTKGNGDVLSIELLRPLEWLSFYEVAVGRTIDLDLSEMGAEGPAEVLAVEHCPHIQSGPGNVVTGTFAHRSSGDLVNLHVAGEPRPIGVTRNHRYWSEDRREFVAAGDLRVGERLLTGTGVTTNVLRVEPRSTDEPVYNLEVYGEHVYLVGRSGLVVHNNYPEFAYRSLNPDDIDNILNSRGVVRAGRKGNQALADVINSNARDTRFIPATESFGVIRRHGDPDNYIKFRPDKLAPGTYRSMSDILSDADIVSRLDRNGIRWVPEQSHSMVIGKIPMEAIEEVVIRGQRWKP